MTSAVLAPAGCSIIDIHPRHAGQLLHDLVQAVAPSRWAMSAALLWIKTGTLGSSAGTWGTAAGAQQAVSTQC
jgi:hypothetical protein